MKTIFISHIIGWLFAVTLFIHERRNQCCSIAMWKTNKIDIIIIAITIVIQLLLFVKQITSFECNVRLSSHTIVQSINPNPKNKSTTLNENNYLIFGALCPHFTCANTLFSVDALILICALIWSYTYIFLHSSSIIKRSLPKIDFTTNYLHLFHSKTPHILTAKTSECVSTQKLFIQPIYDSEFMRFI